jgi:hypothetical protein
LRRTPNAGRTDDFHISAVRLSLEDAGGYLVRPINAAIELVWHLIFALAIVFDREMRTERDLDIVGDISRVAEFILGRHSLILAFLYQAKTFEFCTARTEWTRELVSEVLPSRRRTSTGLILVCKETTGILRISIDLMGTLPR